MKWLELSVEADLEAVDSVAELFSRYGHGGVAIEQPLAATDDPLAPAVDTSRPAVVKTYLPVDEQTPTLQRQIERELWYLGLLRPIAPLQAREVAEEDWSQAWKEHFHVHRVGRRIVIRPSWRDYTPRPDDVVLELDPGMAFGTGLHPTTQMCLRALEQHIRPGCTVLDLGTGSGILAVAAAKLGARKVMAVDTDPVAVTAATSNVAANGLQDVVSVSLGSVENVASGNGHGRPQSSPEPPLRFDLVVENIVADVILSLAVSVANALRPGGVVIAGGILEPRLRQVVERMEQLGFSVLEVLEDGDWRTVVARGGTRRGGS